VGLANIFSVAYSYYFMLLSSCASRFAVSLRVVGKLRRQVLAVGLAGSALLALPAQATNTAHRAASAPAAPSTAASVRGRVLNEEGKPLIGATVFWKGSPFGVTTDSDGNYQLPLAVGHSVVLFSYGGYADDEVSVRSAGVHNVTLLPRETAPASIRAAVPQKRLSRVFR
jgi:CarboxypepD_reg-like domain